MRRVALALLLLLVPAGVLAQPELRSGGVGTTPARPITATAVDANTNALDVSIVAPASLHITCDAGCGGGTTDTDDGSVAGGQVGAIGLSLGQLWTGAAWARMPGDATDGVLVNLGANNDVTVTGAVTANAGTNLNTSALLTTTAHDAAFGTAGTADAQVRTVQGIAGGTAVPVSGTVTATQSTATSLRVAGGDAAGAPTAGTVLAVQGIASGTAVPVSGTFWQATQPVSGNVGVLPLTTGGLSISRTVAAASTNATNIKASAGQVYAVIASNVAATARYVHLYNNAGAPTCGTAIIATFVVPGNTAGAGTNIQLHPGVAFATGIAICFTSGLDGTGNAGANDGVVTVVYK